MRPSNALLVVLAVALLVAAVAGTILWGDAIIWGT
jgi:hypothetical protein